MGSRVEVLEPCWGGAAALPGPGVLGLLLQFLDAEVRLWGLPWSCPGDCGGGSLGLL